MIAAKLVGRWRDGTSLARYPDCPGTRIDPQAAPDNDFLFGEEDPTGSRCPFGAHIRRANPRDGLAPGSREQHAVVNNHRMLRVGRSYGAQTDERGLLFMCVNVDIERQFEFVQQSWILNPQFAGLEDEADPLLGNGAPQRRFTLQAEGARLRLGNLADFVRMRGGGYYFLPGRTAYRFLASAGMHDAYGG
jgi:deferrochelatase/peroxidase EfeB